MSAAGALTGKRPALKPVSFCPVTFSLLQVLSLSLVKSLYAGLARFEVWKDGGNFVLAAHLL
jgi:hypothetical protein